MQNAIRPRVVVITGGSSGIGRSAANLFSQRGWNVVVIARGQEALQAVQASLAGQATKVIAIQADVADTEALRAAASQAEAALGPIDVWVNNAGIGVFAPFMDMSDAEFRRVTDVNYIGVVNGARVALERMKPRNAGTIVNVCSAIGLRGVPLQSAYSGAKYAMRGFAEALRAELAHGGSRVHLTTVYPPSVNTPFYSHSIAHMDGLPRPPPPIYQPEIIADAVYFAATHRRRDVLVGGQTVMAALLNALAPALADRLAGAVAPFAQSSSNQGILAARDPNVFAPSRHVAAVHGAFDAEALSSSLQLWATKNRAKVVAGIGMLGLLTLLARKRSAWPPIAP